MARAWMVLLGLALAGVALGDEGAPESDEPVLLGDAVSLFASGGVGVVMYLGSGDTYTVTSFAPTGELQSWNPAGEDLGVLHMTPGYDAGSVGAAFAADIAASLSDPEPAETPEITFDLSDVLTFVPEGSKEQMLDQFTQSIAASMNAPAPGGDLPGPVVNNLLDWGDLSDVTPMQPGEGSAMAAQIAGYIGATPNLPTVTTQFNDMITQVSGSVAEVVSGSLIPGSL